MKLLVLRSCLSACLCAISLYVAPLASHASAEPGHIVVDVQSPPPPIALLYAVTVDQQLSISATGTANQAVIRVHVLQGRPDIFTVGISGSDTIASVVGNGLHDWSVREETGSNGTARFLDLHLTNAAASDPSHDFVWTVNSHSEVTALPTHLEPVLINPGESATFSSRLVLDLQPGVAAQIENSRGLTLTSEGDVSRRQTFLSNGECRLKLALTEVGSSSPRAELTGSTLTGVLAASGHSGEFVLTTQLHAPRKGVRFPILSGSAALSGAASGEGWHAELVGIDKDNTRYDLVADQAGQVNVTLAFAAAVAEHGEWRAFDFAVPAGTTVPVTLSGFGENVTFKNDAPVAPVKDGNRWKSFLPSDGSLALAWKLHHEAADGALFFTAEEQTDVYVGAGLARAISQIDLKILQGKVPALQVQLDGPGEILNVEGANVTHWAVIVDKGIRRLAVQFSQPVEGQLMLRLTSQAELARLPATIHPLKLVVEGALRDAGVVRLRPGASVRIDPGTTQGLLQLAPSQFPGATPQNEKTGGLVFRFPSNHYDYAVTANRIEPEVSVSQITLYHFTDTDRILESDLELDIREAPLHDYVLLVPAGYTVASVTGQAVSDFSLGESESPNLRALRISFSEPIDGRQLVHLRLEKNEAAKAGEWTLPGLRFPGAKSVRGNIGVVAAAGFRTAVNNVEELAEIPLNTFPQQTARLQQAWRLRSESWSAVVQVEALGQSIQADVFHLYTVKPGVISGSVLINYFVVGAPATEWRIEAPLTLGNLEVLGDQVRRDWHREGNVIVITLHQPVLGAATLLVTFDEPFTDQGAVVQPGEIRPVNVQAERGYIELVSPRQIHSTVQQAEGPGLLALDTHDLPAEFRLLSSAPPLATYQYTDRPFALSFGLQPYSPAETVRQVIDSAKLTSTISRDGEVLTEAIYLAKTRESTPLRLSLPAGLKLWDVEVDHHLVDASMDHDDLVIPLVSHGDTNTAIPVKLRFGQRSGSSEKIGPLHLLAPRTTTPIVSTLWTLHADSGHLLRPVDGTLRCTQRFETRQGFQFSPSGVRTFWTALGLLVAGVWCWRRKSTWTLGLAVTCGLLAVVQIFHLLGTLASTRSVATGASQLEYVSNYLPAGSDLRIGVANTSGDVSAFSIWGWAIALVSLSFIFLAWRQGQRRPWLARCSQAVGFIGVAAGLLLQPDGAAYLLIILLLSASSLAIGSAISLIKQSGASALKHIGRASQPGATGLVLAFAFVFLVHGPTCSMRANSPGVASAWIQPGAKVAERCDQTWTIRDHRIFGTLDLTIRANAGDSFVLLRPPAILSNLSTNDLRLNRQETDGETLYTVEAMHSGLLHAHATFEMPLSNYSEKISVPSGQAVSQRLTVQFNQGGWDISADDAVKNEAAPSDAQHSGATLVLAPAAQSFVQLHPRQRDPSSEPVEFYDEAQQLYLAGSGSISGISQFTVRPVQGQVSELIFDVPAGAIIGDVKGRAIGLWRFDPATRRLQVAVEPAQTKPFIVRVESQITTAALPYEAKLSPMRLKNARGDSGTMALALEGDVTLESVHPNELTVLSATDFDARRLLDRKVGVPVQNLWHYGAGNAAATLRVAAMEPEVRVESKQLFSLDDDRVVASIELEAAITRVGIFQLSFTLPENLEVEAISGSALAQWNEKSELGQHLITLQLREQTLGETSFALTLSGPAPRHAGDWKIPAITLREANRQAGTFIVVPGKGLRLRTLTRQHATPLDPQALGAVQPGTLAFKQLDAEAAVTLGLETLTPWVTTQLWQEVSVRDGQTATHATAHIRVENAGVKQLLIRIPGLSAAAQRTVRATGTAVSELVKQENSPDLWNLRFARTLIGETDLQIDFQTAASPSSAEDHRTIAPVVFTEARQRETVVSVHAAGRLEADALGTAKGWERADANVIPAVLRGAQPGLTATECFQVADNAEPLTFKVSRHAIAEALKMEISAVELTTLLSSQHGELTAAELRVRLAEKTRAQFSLPPQSRLYAVTVNGETVELTREGEKYFFYVQPGESGHANKIDVIYAVDSNSGRTTLEAPQFSLPVENVSWRVLIPVGFRLGQQDVGADWMNAGTQERSGTWQADLNETTPSLSGSKRGLELLDAASASLAGGDQQKAVEFLQKAATASGLDEASNEDARVQLKKLKTEQAQLSLTTRRERLSLHLNQEFNSGADATAVAAAQNPLLRDAMNFDPQQLDQLLAANSAEENEQLTDIAAHLVDHQFDQALAPRQISPSLAADGSVTTFTRSLQVDPTAPLHLAIQLEDARANQSHVELWLLFAAGLAGFLLCGRAFKLSKNT